ncbi:hypothetical protein CASFOL_013998 [Castilleja foliolosa]|uniref:RNA helicase n=1 Tax=Castilleja foliolosa TaxID=1961234 RepID=A0ABD3DLL0_9LAMI
MDASVNNSCSNRHKTSSVSSRSSCPSPVHTPSRNDELNVASVRSCSNRQKFYSVSRSSCGASPVSTPNVSRMDELSDASVNNICSNRRKTFSASHWDIVAPLPTRIRASGPSFNSHRKTNKFNSSLDNDPDWFDREGGTVYDGNNSSYFLGDEASFQKKEAALGKKLVRRDGSTFSQSKKHSLMAADNARWEDRQLLSSGAVRGTKLTTEFDEEKQKVLLVHDTRPPFLDGSIFCTKKAELIMPFKDPTSDMAILSRKGSNLVREIHTKQSINKSRQRFRELAEQIDADTAVVGEQVEIDFKEDAKFAQHLKKDEAVSDFAKTKTLSQQRQYLPIFSVRDELLQVIRENQVVVVVGETGSGKTTQLTQYLHKDKYTVNGIVGCTQPRRVAAMSVAKRVSDEMETKVGDKVGYVLCFEDGTGPNTLIKYMTDGVLLRETERF